MANRRHVGAVIVEELVNNMRAGAERLYYTVQVPAVYRVYVHQSDYEKLLPVEKKLVAEAKQALDEELASRNRRGAGGLRDLPSRVRGVGRAARRLLGRPARSAPMYERGGGDWQIKLYPDTGNDLKAGDVVVESELAAASGVEPGAGQVTKTIRTMRLDGMTDSFVVDGERTVTARGAEPAAGRRVAPPEALALISYKDGRGRRREYLMRKEKINVGRGNGPDKTQSFWVDLPLDADPDVSPLHLQLSFDPASRKFYLKDLSASGTRVNGRLVTSSVGRRDGKPVDLDVTEELPPDARISLSNKLLLDFKSLVTG